MGENESGGGRGFFVMYGEAIKTLQDELVAVLGTALSRSFLFRFGYKCGKINAREMGLNAQGKNAINYLGEIWMEMGLARPISIEDKGKEIEIHLTETLESSFGGNGCDFTRGFLGGLMAGITNLPHFCSEKQCVSKEAEVCVFILTEEEKGR